MPTQEFYYTIAMGASAFAFIYFFASIYSNDVDDESFTSMVLRSMPFITRSLGILRPLSGFLLLCSYIFQGVASTQRAEVTEASSFNKAVLAYPGSLTLLFASALVGYFAGKVYNKAKTRQTT